MKSASKTNSELIKENSLLKQRIKELEQSEESDRKRAEEALREGESKFRTLFETANDAIFLMDQAIFIDCNPKTLEMFACTREQFIGQPPYLFSPELQPDGRKSIEKAQEKIKAALNGQSQCFEWKHSRYDGTLFDAEVGLNTFSAAGKYYLHAIVRDITERKQTEEALHEERQKFRTMSDNAPFGMVMIARDGTFTYLNPKFKKLFGYDLSDMPDGRTWFRKAYPEDAEYRHGVISAWVADLGDAKSGEEKPNVFTVTCKDGTQKIVQFISSVLITGDYLMTCEDITEHKRMEEAIQYQNLLLTTQQEASVDGILVVNDQGAVLSYNRRFVEIWGIPPEVLKTRVGEQLLQAVMGKLAMPEEFLRKMKYLYEHQQETSRDEIALADGRVLDRYSAAVVGDEGKYYGRVWYFRDVTEQKQILNALKRREKELIVKSKTLEEVNVALKVLLEQRERDKTEQEDKILFNVRKLILPYIDSLRQRRLDDEQTTYLDILETNLKNVISPFAKKLTSIQENFTPLEIRVADFIRGGKTAKEIAKTFCVSEAAINMHRQHIRNKLGLNNKKINLTTYLLSLTS